MPVTAPSTAESSIAHANRTIYDAPTNSRKARSVLKIFVLLLLGAMSLAYFEKPKPPLLNIVTPKQILPSAEDKLPGDTRIAERVARTYGIAFVLVKSPYTEKNVIALETLRSWARDKFQREPDFLHPVRLDERVEAKQTIFDALTFNLVAPIRYFLEEKAGDLLAERISRFQTTQAYRSFITAYFDVFGVDPDTATMLAVYLTERAKTAIPVLLAGSLWLSAALLAVVSLVRARRGYRYDRFQRVLAGLWLLLAVSYLVEACYANQISTLLAAFAAACTGTYILRPVALDLVADGQLRLRSLRLTSGHLAIIFWVSFTLLTIQFLTWLRTGTLENPDPITQWISSATGNFLYDHARTKGTLTRLLGAVWLSITIWAAVNQRSDARAEQETLERLASLPRQEGAQ